MLNKEEIVVLDKVKIGKYICSMRKKFNLTQQELADKLYISDRAVSKWERGISIPDISTLINLSNIFRVNMSDILLGIETTSNKKEDSILKTYLKEYLNINKSKLYLIIILFLYLLGIFIFYTARLHNINILPLDYLEQIYNNFTIVPFTDIIGLIIHPNDNILATSIIKNIIVNVVISLPICLLLIKCCSDFKQYKKYSFIILVGMEFIKLFSLLGIFDIDDIIIRLLISCSILKFYNRKEVKK